MNATVVHVSPVYVCFLQVGGLLVDGLGDGAIIEAPHEDLDFLRTTSFGLLQVSFNRDLSLLAASCAALACS